MRFIVYLLTLFFVGTAVAQNPTILSGNYITNVFGQSNFIKNPNAQSNTLNITVSGGVSPTASVTRSTTTPLVATTEFLVGVSSANGTITWATRTFDAGMKNQNCEARFSYRGFQSTSKAQIFQGANKVAELALSATGTDPRIASINFPCGDLSSATTFVITDTSTLGGVNEIGGIYLGLATNQANVAQAEVLFRAQDTNGGSIPQGTSTTVVFPSVVFDSLGAYNASTGSYTVKKAGRYSIHARVAFAYGSYGANSDNYLLLNKNGTSFSTGFWSTVAFTGYPNPQITGVVDLVVGDVITVSVLQNTGATRALLGSNALWSEFTVSRFPTSSELVVTPERQNVFGGARWSGNIDSSLTASTAEATLNTTNFGSPAGLGKAQVTSLTDCGLVANDIGFCLKNVPPGTYQFSANLQLGAVGNVGTPGQAVCNAFGVVSGTSLSATKVSQAFATNGSTTSSEDWTNLPTGLITISSFQSNLAVYITRNKNSSNGGCLIRSANISSPNVSLPALQLIPVDQPSNSALYVQGPVKASETGDTIPTGYQNEWSTRSISDTSMRSQSSPTVNTKYYPWTGELTLPTGNWQICYRIMTQLDQNSSSTTVGRITAGIENKTDSTELFSQDVFATKGSTVTTLAGNLSSCENVAISSSKIFRVFIKYQNDAGTPTVNTIYLRNDLNTGKLWATRLN